MKVHLLSCTEYPVDVVYAAARQCYSAGTASSLFHAENADAKVSRFVEMLAARGHESPLEHASFTFSVEGISRVATHQLVRHRVASYSQQSMRYVEGVPDLVDPPSVLEALQGEASEEVRAVYDAAVQSAAALYRVLLSSGVPAEDARYYLPHGCASNLVVTMNARELRHFFRVRLCSRAQWEIRELAAQMLTLVRDVAGPLFAGAGPACVAGPCPEGPLSCGKPWSHA